MQGGSLLAEIQALIFMRRIQTHVHIVSRGSLGSQNLFWLGMKASDYAGLLNINTTHAKRSWGDRSYAIDTDARHQFSDFVIFSKEDVTKKNRYIQSPDTQIGEEKYIRLGFFLTIWWNLNNSEWALLWHRWLLDSTFNSNFICLSWYSLRGISEP